MPSLVLATPSSHETQNSTPTGSDHLYMKATGIQPMHTITSRVHSRGDSVKGLKQRPGCLAPHRQYCWFKAQQLEGARVRVEACSNARGQALSQPPTLIHVLHGGSHSARTTPLSVPSPTCWSGSYSHPHPLPIPPQLATDNHTSTAIRTLWCTEVAIRVTFPHFLWVHHLPNPIQTCA